MPLPGDAFPPPYIPLPTLHFFDDNDDDDDNDDQQKKNNNSIGEMIIGRRDIIIALSSFCRCLEGTVKEERSSSSFRPSSNCAQCTYRSSWIKRFVSTKMLRFCIHCNNHENNDSWTVELLGANKKVVFVNGQELKKGTENIMTVAFNSEILLRNISKRSDNMDNHNNKKKMEEEEEEDSALFTIGHVVVNEEHCKSLKNNCQSKTLNDNQSLCTTTAVFLQERQVANDGKCCEEYHANKDCLDQLEVQVQQDGASLTVQNTLTVADDCASHGFPRDDLRPSQNNDNVIDLISLDDENSTDEADVGQMSTSHVDVDCISFTEMTRKSDTNTEKHNSVFFLQRGQQMSNIRVSFLIKSLHNQANENNLQIQMHFDKKNPPKYIVIDPNLSIESVRKELGFQDVTEMANALEKVHLVKPEWIIQYAKSQSNFDDMTPTMAQCWSGAYILLNIREVACNDEVKTRCESNILKKRRTMSHDSDSESEENASIKTTRLSYNHGAISSQNQQRNLKLSKVFEQISKLYSDCPLSMDDTWRSYSYNIVSKRLQYLDFEVTNDTDCLKKLASIKGFGSKVIKQCKEFLTSGKCQLIREFEHDDRRIAVRNMTKIWGVGPVKAWELVDMGYKNILDVRRALELKQLDLSAGARVGVQFYEDFQEKMGRFEVRMISKIVEESVKKYFPAAEVMTMGSYRRGKQLCGDVDILITHRDYTRAVPLGALDELVERLKSKGHISHHLTHVDTKYFNAMLSRDGEFNSSVFTPQKASQSYMGVFNSPSLKGKHRRIDIKFYPYQEKAFAMMYFTGNGFFNRSIRLYAKRHENCMLNDHGLFPDHLGGAKSLKAKDEQGVFDHLGLVYREPKDRDGFDAVVEKETNQVFVLDDVNKNEIMSEDKIARHSKWVD